MEALFELLEDGEEQETQVPEIRERSRNASFGKDAEEKRMIGPERMRGRTAGTPEEGKGNAERTFDEARQISRVDERPGDLVQKLLSAAKESAEREKTAFTMPEIWGYALAVGGGSDTEEASLRPGLTSERSEETGSGGADEPWFERARTRFAGTQRLYREIRTDRLRGLEQERRSVVVRLDEARKGADGAGVTDIRALDRAFRQDARRYDGGLSPL